jgi:hypothetical protein
MKFAQLILMCAFNWNGFRNPATGATLQEFLTKKLSGGAVKSANPNLDDDREGVTRLLGNVKDELRDRIATDGPLRVLAAVLDMKAMTEFFKDFENRFLIAHRIGGQPRLCRDDAQWLVEMIDAITRENEWGDEVMDVQLREWLEALAAENIGNSAELTTVYAVNL